MRCTIDLDSGNLELLHGAIMDGLGIFGRYPDEVWFGSNKGYHLVWYGCQEELVWFMRWLWDDWNRIRLDLCSNHRERQVLFNKKACFKAGGTVETGKTQRWS
jgi:hypothetical protein